MGVLSILNSDHATFESDIMTRRRSKTISHDKISANPQASCPRIVLLYPTKLEQNNFS
jgi:hypothetical protein